MDFSAALDTRRADLPKPKSLPQGTYNWTVTKFAFSEVKSAKGEWDVVEFSIRPVMAHDDVDQDELAEYGDLKSGINRISFMFTKAPDEDNERIITKERLEAFLVTTLRVDGSDDEDTTLKALIAAAPNCQFVARATWDVQEDRTYVRVKDYMPLD